MTADDAVRWRSTRWAAGCPGHGGTRWGSGHALRAAGRAGAHPPWGSVAVPPWERPVGVVPTWDWIPSTQGDAEHNSWPEYLFLSLCTQKKKKIPRLCQKPTSATPVCKWWGEGLQPRTTGTCRLLLALSVPGIQGFRSEAEPHTAALSRLSPPLPFTGCRDQGYQQQRACCPSHGREPSALLCSCAFPSLHLSAVASLHAEGADAVWASSGDTPCGGHRHPPVSLGPRQNCRCLHLPLKLPGRVTFTQRWREALHSHWP